MNKNILLSVIGVVLVLAGVLGFVVPGLFGMHLSGLHNAIHIVSGLLALYFGLKGTPSAARLFSLVFGSIYGLLGMVGLLAGGTHGMWVVIPNHLALGMADHIVHIVLGVVLVFVGVLQTAKVVRPQTNL